MSKKTSMIILIIAALLLAAAVYLFIQSRKGSGGTENSEPKGFVSGTSVSFAFDKTDEAIKNPLMGFAAEADYTAAVADNNLVYIGLKWSELEPEKGEFAFDEIIEKYNLDRWRREGKHLVLRFICDYPGTEEHIDIPQWLYDEIEGDGTNYEMDGRYGFSPNYSNKTFIEYHRLAIKALGDYFDSDSFLAYVQLGSLGHWGEWHVNYDYVEDRIPSADIRREYILPYTEYFTKAKLLMRRPFNEADEFSMGLYNDMAGHIEATDEWTDWIENGGDYNQALEKDALTPMPDSYKIAPVGGELNSDYTVEYMLRFNAEQTASLIGSTHTTFLGPKCPVTENMGSGYTEGVELLIRNMGYRFSVKSGTVDIKKDSITGNLTLKNSGVAPMYFKWPVCLYLVDGSGNVIARYELEFDITSLLPDSEKKTSFNFKIPDIDVPVKYLCLGIEDPMTEKPSVKFVMNAEHIDDMAILYTFDGNNE